MSTANFRTSIGGFHRGDVVNFIEETSIAHEKTVRKLKEDSSKLQQQLAAALAERDALAAQLEQAQLALEAQDVPKQECGEQIQSSQPVSCEASRTAELDELELAAYRRAEAAERSAQQRANRLFRQVNHLVQDAAGKFAAPAPDSPNWADSCKTASSSSRPRSWICSCFLSGPRRPSLIWSPCP